LGCHWVSDHNSAEDNKLRHVEVVVPLLIQAQYFLHPGLSKAIGTRFGERLPTPPKADISFAISTGHIMCYLHTTHKKGDNRKSTR
jgi:hypothetical protein